jgi:hypothetical protein
MIKNKPFTQYFKPILCFALLAMIYQPSLANDDTSDVVKTEYFQSIDGKVDPETFVGWSVFHHACVECHGVGAVGSALAPDLTQSIDGMSPGRFRAKVLHRISMSFTEGDWTAMKNAMMDEVLKQEKRDRGELKNMPKWHYNPTIKLYISNIYSYLKARSAGAIGPDKPGIIRE